MPPVTKEPNTIAENPQVPVLATQAFYNSSTGFIFSNLNLEVTAANPAACKLLGTNELNPGDSLLLPAQLYLDSLVNAIKGHNPTDQKDPEKIIFDAPTVSHNQVRILRWRVDRQGENLYFIEVNDITQEERYRQESLIDPLTKLPNRRFLGKVIDAATGNQNTYGIIGYADVVGLHNINSEYGHTAGGQVLKLTAQALRDSIRQQEPDLAAKGSDGDEFAIVILGVDPKFVEIIQKRIQGQLKTINQNSTVEVKLKLAFTAWGKDTGTSAQEALDKVKDEVKKNKSR